MRLQRTIALIERTVADKLIETDAACAESTAEISQIKLATLQKLKTDMLLSAPHIYRDYVHPDELLNILNSHIDCHTKHESLEDSKTSNTPAPTPQKNQNLS